LFDCFFTGKGSYINGGQSNFELEYLGQFFTELGAQVGSIDGKNQK
jgi:hypothetical protein